MAMEVMLMDAVANLGKEGDVVRVANGYARNYLLPRNLAAPVTAAAQRRLETLKREREEEQKELAAQAKALAERLSGVSVTLAVKTSDGEHLYGSVGAAEVVAALEAQGYSIERSAVEIPVAIKELGVYDVKVALPAGQDATIKAWVVEE